MRFAHIFVVEEDRDMRDLLVQLLIDEGQVAKGFDSGSEALEAVATSVVTPNLFFGCLRFFSAVRPQWESMVRQVPVVLATGAEGVPRQTGVGVLKKPFTIAAILAAFECLEEKSGRDEPRDGPDTPSVPKSR
jgi:DNA-binding NtrC family response regulator